MFTQLLEKAKPGLSSYISLEKTLISRDQAKMLVCLHAARPVDAADENAILRALRQNFGKAAVSLRITYPALGQHILENGPGEYLPVLISQLSKKHPTAPTLLSQAEFLMADGALRIEVPHEFERDYMQNAGIDKDFSQLLSELYKIALPVEVRIMGDEAARIRRIQAQREEAQRQMAQIEAVPLPASERPAPAPAPREESAPIYGRSIAQPPIAIERLTEDMTGPVIEGEVISCETREISGGDKLLYAYALTDYTGTLTCKLFLPKTLKALEGRRGKKPTQEVLDERRQLLDQTLVPGNWVRVRGDYRFDTFAKEMTLMTTDMERAEAPTRPDSAPVKRVELHLHTQMSAMDSVLSVKDAIGQAAKWGHPAVAITDHGVLQALPEAFSEAKKQKIKLIPGCEGYLVPDTAEVVKTPGLRPLSGEYVVLDVETTGLSPQKDAITEIGAVRIRDGQIVDEFSALVNPLRPIPEKVVALTGITDAMLRDQPPIAEIAPKLHAFLGEATMVAHNADFDAAFVKNALAGAGLAFHGPVLDTLTLARNHYPTMRNHRLGTLAKALGVSLANAHRAVHDARATAQIFLKMLEEVRLAHNLRDLHQLNQIFKTPSNGKRYHILLLARTQKGLENLNWLVSSAHLNHFNRRPHIPRSELAAHREGLIVGSACEAGELIRTMVEGTEEAEIERIASFYDFLEIQPIGNNQFLVENGSVPDEEGLREINRRIVRLGEKLNKPVAATGDVHFLNPRDAQFRAIIMAANGYEDADSQPPLYFKPTHEMLEDFAYLGPEKAHEVVVDVPRRIADMVEPISLFIPHPQGKETFQPSIENAEEDIRGMTMERAHRLYGDPLPELIQKRLDKELASIIGYGFATLYSIAQKLVKKSLDDGYIVGSRGSVGSSLVAFMTGITEVNPLPPHYACPNCQFSQFENVGATCGLDLPAKDCPHCQTPMLRDGYDTPFEVFLGFEGDKVPDIDLNFSGEYQPKAHAFVEELFGRENVFRAGTISTLADKTAYGYVVKYLEERGKTASRAEIDRLVRGCMGVKRTTGQHPGGIVVLPKEYTIHQFTAIQRPANDPNSPTVTTHYDFGSMHDVLVKLDILGHDDPTMLRRLQELTGIAPKDVPLGEKEVYKTILSLFSGPQALGLTPEESGLSTGTLGIPEFGTKFVRQMLEDTRPTTMEELIRISGLSHGTDVWLGNAQELIRNGTAVLSQCICTREDIMNPLISWGVDFKVAFQTMESVRKGKGLTPAMEEAMRNAHTPEWFIESCKKIKYMFPKGHAVAYVLAALRIAYFKVYHPVAYYACYLQRNRDSFDASIMVAPAQTLKRRYQDLQEKGKEATAKEQDDMALIEILLEMLMRDISFSPPDVYRSDPVRFLVESKTALRPPLSTLPGVGVAAAQNIAEVRAEGPFISQEDMVRRRIGKSVVETLRANGCLGDMPQSSQVSLFDAL